MTDDEPAVRPRDRPAACGRLAGRRGRCAVLVAVVAGRRARPGVAAARRRSRPSCSTCFPACDLHSGLTEREIAIITELRLPRVVLGLLVGAMLALAGGCYQGVFRNPLADPYLLGVAAGAGLGATAAIALAAPTGAARLPIGVPLAAFAGALVAVALTYLLGVGRRPGPLAGHADPGRGRGVGVPRRRRRPTCCSATSTRIREVYSWLLGRLATAGWHDVLLLLPYAVVTAVVVLAQRRELDVLSVGDEEAAEPGPAPAAHPG